MVDRLPAYGSYKSQMVMDEDWARYIVDQEEEAKLHPPADVAPVDPDLYSPFGYTPEISRLDSILDRLQSLETAVMWTANPKADRPKVTPVPRPETALDKERDRRTRSLLEEVDLLFREGLLFE